MGSILESAKVHRKYPSAFHIFQEYSYRLCINLSPEDGLPGLKFRNLSHVFFFLLLKNYLPIQETKN